jgi:hypothetical protein
MLGRSSTYCLVLFTYFLGWSIGSYGGHGLDMKNWYWLPIAGAVLSLCFLVASILLARKGR